jgi:hypothetical protein
MCIQNTTIYKASEDVLYERSRYYDDNFSECMNWTEINEPSLHNQSPTTKMCIQNTTMYKCSGYYDGNFSECMNWTKINGRPPPPVFKRPTPPLPRCVSSTPPFSGVSGHVRVLWITTMTTFPNA